MKTHFIVLNPDYKTLKAITDATLLNYGSFSLVGDRSQILYDCLRYNFNYRLFRIYDCRGEINICLEAERIYHEYDQSYFIKGNISLKVFNVLLSNIGEDNLGQVLVIDSPFLKNLLFVSFLGQNDDDFYYQSISLHQSYLFFKKVQDIEPTIVIIENGVDAYDSPECQLIKMYWNRKLKLSTRIYSGIKLEDLTSKNQQVSIYNQVSLIFLRNSYYIYNIMDSNYIINQGNMGLFLLSNTLKTIIIDDRTRSDDLLFSIYLLHKTFQNNMYQSIY